MIMCAVCRMLKASKRLHLINHSVLTYKWFPVFVYTGHLFKISSTFLLLTHLAGIRHTSVSLPICPREYNTASDDTRNATHTIHGDRARWYIKFTFLLNDGFHRWYGAKDFRMIPGTHFVPFRFATPRKKKKKKKQKEEEKCEMGGQFFRLVSDAIFLIVIFININISNESYRYHPSDPSETSPGIRRTYAIQRRLQFFP